MTWPLRRSGEPYLRWCYAERAVVGRALLGSAPVLLVGGWTIAATLQPPSFDPVTDMVSALAALALPASG